MKLYQLTTGLGIYWVVDKDPTSAQRKLESIFNSAKFGLQDDRKVTNIKLLAEAITEDPESVFDNKHLLL